MLFSSLIDQLDDDPNVKGGQFELLCQWYLRNAPEYRHKLKNVWLWSEWPGRWGPDKGIDVVCETNDGDLWAVQAKAYKPDQTISKPDIDSFLSESNRPEIAFRLLLATTDLVGRNAHRTMVGQEKPVGFKGRTQLEREPVDWPSDIKSLDDAPARSLHERRPHQQEAVRDVVAGFGSGDRGQLIMACGTGKTLTALWLAEDLDSERTLVLVPSLSLLSQTMREWTANALKPFDYLAVCSDRTVVGRDSMVSHTADLGLPVTTEAAVIKKFLRGAGRLVIFSTYQSSPAIAEAQAGGASRFDLAIADEAHRCTGSARTAFTTILDSEQILASRRLFMTATPRYFSGRIRKLAGDADYEVASMDDEEQFGPVFHQLTFGEAIERELLSDYQVVVVGVDEATYVEFVERGQFFIVDGERVTDARTLGSHIGLAKAMRKYNLRRTISFHGRIKKAQQFSTTFPGVVEWMPKDERPPGGLWASHVSGEMLAGRRDALLGEFRSLAGGTRGLLSNARCLAEGVDVPEIDCVTFIDPKSSTIDIIQAVGRAIRRSPEKQRGVIVLPVFVSSDREPEQALEDSSFKPVWNVLKALRAHDSVLAEELDSLRRSLGKERGIEVRRPDKIVLDLPTRVSEEFARAFDARLVTQTTASWEFRFGMFQHFVEENGHTRVPRGYKRDSVNLGFWVNAQAQAYTQDTLLPERQRRLEALGWSGTPLDDQWEKAFAMFRRFVEQNGHALVPRAYKKHEINLGNWLRTQRLACKRNELLPERQGRLEALGFRVSVPDDRWELWFAMLQRFVEREGHSRVPRNYEEEKVKLGVWVTEQRRVYSEREMLPERQRRLEALGFSLSPLDDDWEASFAIFQRFVERQGHARVPQSYKTDDINLGTWVLVQRRACKRNDLFPERQRRLEALGFSASPLDDEWEAAFAMFRRFVEQNGHAAVPWSHKEEGVNLAQWVSGQRRAYKKGKLSLERQRRLDALGWVAEIRRGTQKRG